MTGRVLVALGAFAVMVATAHAQKPIRAMLKSSGSLAIRSDRKVPSRPNHPEMIGFAHAKIATKRKFRPLKSIQANAYAANRASVIGMMTAGNTITNEFRKNPPKPPDPLSAVV